MKKHHVCECGEVLKIPEDKKRFRCEKCFLIFDPYNLTWFGPVQSPITKDSWKRREEKATFRYMRVKFIFSREDMERICWGCLPRSMDEKWFIYQEGDWLFFHRSWTGILCYKAKIESNTITQVAMDAKFKPYKNSTFVVLWLVLNFLVGSRQEYPSLDTPRYFKWLDRLRNWLSDHFATSSKEIK